MEFYLIYRFEYKSTRVESQELTKKEKDIINDVKKTIDYKQIISLKQTLSGINVYEYFQNKMYIPTITKIDSRIFYSEFLIETVQFNIIFFEFVNSELITPSLLKTDTVVATSIDRHIKILNNITNQDKILFDNRIHQLMYKLSEKHFYDLTFHPLEIMLNTQLYFHQKDNINWMINIESNLESNLESNYICIKRHINFPDGRIYEYETNKFINSNTESDSEFKIKVRGGLIFDDPGIGKTLQFICLGISNPSIKTLILVPNHLYDHWINQFKIHLKSIEPDDMNNSNSNSNSNLDPIPNWITLIRFSDYLAYSKSYDRIIIDEIHELYSKSENNQIFKKACFTKTLYKWGLTGTPFPIDSSIYNLIQFLTSTNILNNYVEKLEPNIDIYKNFMKKNTLSNISEQIVLPELEITNNFINFTTKEQIIYDAEKLSNTNANKEILRKLCCDTILAVEYENSIQYSNVNLMIKNYFEKQFLESRTKLDELVVRLENAIKVNESIKSLELEANITHYKREIQSQELIVKSRQRSLTFLLDQFKELPMCPICMGDIDIDTNCSVIVKCSHVFCTGCIEYITEITKSECKCPNCRETFNKSDLIKVSSNNTIQKYPSKINKLIEIINSIDKQIIIFTQYDKLIDKIKNILNNENIQTNIYNSSIDVDEFKEKKYKVIILSSTNNASGLDLSFVNNIIIFEPVIGTYNYLRDIEKQIIGRIYRINQKQKTFFHRLIISNTIEEEIYKEIL
jgi:SNF2 family DNA or RNA helicase